MANVCVTFKAYLIKMYVTLTLNRIEISFYFTMAVADFRIYKT